MSEDSTDGKSRLKNLLKEKDQKKPKPIDWEKKKNDWLVQVRKLYAQIESWFGDLGNIRIEKQKISINEEYIGSYESERMLIYLNDSLVSLIPRGTIIVAARGRIDIQGPNGGSMIVLMGKGERPIITIKEGSTPLPPPQPDSERMEYGWLIINKRKMEDLQVLDEDTFSELIADLIE